jgi:hypothetical protein
MGALLLEGRDDLLVEALRSPGVFGIGKVEIFCIIEKRILEIGSTNFYRAFDNWSN